MDVDVSSGISGTDDPGFPSFYWSNTHGEKRFARHETPDEPKATIFWAHGMNGHMGSSTQDVVFSQFIAAGFEVFSFDQIGHGRSATDEFRGNLPSWRFLIDDMFEFLVYLMENYPQIKQRKFFLGGSSMGGLVMLHVSHKLQGFLELSRADRPGYELFSFNQAVPLSIDIKNFSALLEFAKQKYGGTVLNAPALLPIAQPNWLMTSALSVANYFGGGSLALGPRPQLSQFLTSESFNRFMTDKYSYSGPLRLSFGHNLLEMANVARSLIPSISFPFLVLHGSKDASVLLSGSEELINSSKTLKKDKELVVFADAGHGLIEDPRSAKVFDVISNWVTGRLRL